MVSWMYTYLKTHQVVYIKHVEFLYVNHASIKWFKKHIHIYVKWLNNTISRSICFLKEDCRKKGMLNPTERIINSTMTRYLWTVDITWKTLGVCNFPDNSQLWQDKRLTSSPNNHKYFYSLSPSLPAWEVFNIQLRNKRGTLSLGQMKRSLLPQSLGAPASLQAPSLTLAHSQNCFHLALWPLSLTTFRPRSLLFGHHKWLKPKRAASVIGLSSTPPVACVYFVLHPASLHFSGL